MLEGCVWLWKRRKQVFLPRRHSRGRRLPINDVVEECAVDVMREGVGATVAIAVSIYVWIVGLIAGWVNVGRRRGQW